MIPKTLKLSNFVEQQRLWPAEGRVLLAQYDEERVIVYQAYNRYIANFAVRNGCFGGGGFSSGGGGFGAGGGSSGSW